MDGTQPQFLIRLGDVVHPAQLASSELWWFFAFHESGSISFYLRRALSDVWRKVFWWLNP